MRSHLAPLRLLLLISLAPLPAAATPGSSGQSGVRDRPPVQLRTHRFRGRRLSEVDTRTGETAQAHVRATKNMVTLLYNPYSSEFGHQLLKVGEAFGDLGGTRSAPDRNFGRYVRNKGGMVGFSFEVTRPENLPAVEAEMKRELESLRRYNLPVFSSFSRRTVLKPKPDGNGFDILPPVNGEQRYRFFEARGTAEAELVHEQGRAFLRSPNGVMVPAQERSDGTVVVEARSCTSWPSEFLSKHAEALGIPRLGLKKDAKNLTKELMRGNVPHVPDHVWVYTTSPGQTDMENFAQKIGDKSDRNLTGGSGSGW